MFAPHVRASYALGAPHSGFAPGYLHRLAAQIHEQASWPHPGPVHINQPFREPLLPAEPVVGDDIPARLLAAQSLPQPDAEQITELVRRISGRPGAIVCGEMPANPGQNAALAELARRLACPILAEPLSGLRFGPHDRSHVCVGYNRWLDGAAAHEHPAPEWILRFGAFPVTRNLQTYVSGNAGIHIVVDPWPRWVDPSRQITHLLRADPTAFCLALLREKLAPAADGWLAAFTALEKQAMQERALGHIAAVLDALPTETALFIGNSLAIRQVDSLSGHADKTLHLYANRGASGIDGNISTAAGIASVQGRTVALIGDLTCQHDIGGLALTRGLDIVIVTVNNGGGGIFDYLPQHSLPEFIQGWRTPQEVDFEHAAGAFGLGYQCTQSASELRGALDQALASGGPHLIELMQS
jgi:2-succinyl-5-enolpyruvyl-6-hydroxy-3-cyclohexene-1-carboxylate synthase